MPDHVARMLLALRAALRSERGDTMIEVAIGALVLGLIAAATLTGFTATAHISADERRHAHADALAQADEDRLRGLTVNQLSGAAGDQTTTTTIAGTTYTIQSSSTFVSASGGSSSCSTSGTGTADFVETSSSVTWTNMNGRPAVVAHGLITPPVGGAIVAHVTDASNNGVASVAVTTTDAGGAASTINTDSAGCAVFGGLALGNASVSISKAGYVDVNGNSSPPALTPTVLPTATAPAAFEYGQGGTIAASFTTSVPSAGTASKAATIVVHNNGITSPPLAYRVFGTPSTSGANNHVLTVTSPATVFPFASSYTVYAGSCTADDPSLFAGTDATALVTGGATTPVTVPLPAMIVKVYSGTTTGSALLGSQPHVTLTDTGCGNVEDYPLTQIPTAAGGALVNPGEPYGHFTVCADNGTVRNTGTVINQSTSSTVNVFLGSGAVGRVNGVCT